VRLITMWTSSPRWFAPELRHSTDRKEWSEASRRAHPNRKVTMASRQNVDRESAARN